MPDSIGLSLDSTFYIMFIDGKAVDSFSSNTHPVYAQPMIIDKRIYRIWTPDIKEEVTTCEELKAFRNEFPYFYIDKAILKRFNCNAKNKK